MVQFIMNSPARAGSTGEKRCVSMQTSTTMSIIVSAFTTPIQRDIHPPAIFPSIVTKPTSNIMASVLAAPSENSLPR